MRVFIGHGFNDYDAPLIDRIKSFLKKNDIDYQTGEPVENKSISEKVRKHIDECSVFLGIFTCDKEILSQSSFLAQVRYRLNRDNARQFVALDHQKVYSTSNWVIQESGYALGKGRSLVLMVEEGVYKFPELQGDLQYIPFNRNSLDKSLADILQYLRKIDNLPATSAPTSSKDSALEKNEDVPKESADGLPYSEMFEEYLTNKRIDSAEKIYLERIRPKLSSDKADYFDAVVLRWKYNSGHNDALKKLEDLYKKTQDKEIGVLLGLAYEDVDRHPAAREIYSTLLSRVANANDKAELVVHIAEAYSEEGDFVTARQMLLDSIGDLELKERHEHILYSLIKILEKDKDDLLLITLLEYGLSINPVNTDFRFKLAYKYSDMGQHGLALLHYKKITNNIEHPTASNNLGVAYSSLGCPIRSVMNYEKALQGKNTLAASNLANIYIKSGFVDDAERVLNKADELGRHGVEVDKGVVSSRQKLNESVDKEREKVEKISKDIEPVAVFKARHANLFCAPIVQQKDFSGYWIIKDFGKVLVSADLSTGLFSGSLLTDVEAEHSTPLAFFGGSNKYTKKRTVEIKGRFRGEAGYFILSLKEEDPFSRASLLGGWGDKARQGIFIASNNGFDVLEQSGDGNVLTAWSVEK